MDRCGEEGTRTQDREESLPSALLPDGVQEKEVCSVLSSTTASENLLCGDDNAAPRGGNDSEVKRVATAYHSYLENLGLLNESMGLDLR